MGTDPYGKPAWEYRFDGGMDDMAESLRIQLSQDVGKHFDHKLYETGMPMTEGGAAIRSCQGVTQTRYNGGLIRRKAENG